MHQKQQKLTFYKKYSWEGIHFSSEKHDWK